jgi:signal transduction histidine kinase
MATIDAGAAIPPPRQRSLGVLWQLLKPPHGFARSSGGIVFAIFCGVSALLCSLLGYISYQSSLNNFLRDKAAEDRTAFELADAFVSTYAGVTASLHPTPLPVPQAFRALAFERFNAARGANEGLHVTLIGLPGREIATKAPDADVATAITSLAAEPNPAIRDYFYESGHGPVLRTLYPSIASQQSCVDCHNSLQPGAANWKLNDVMGALVLDLPAGGVLADMRRHAILVAAATFLASVLVAFHLMALVFRRAQNDAEQHSHALLAEAVAGLRDGISLYGADGRVILTTAAQPQSRDPATVEIAQGADKRWRQIRQSHTPSGKMVRVESDITDLMEHEAELRRAKDEAEQANRAKSEFLAMMSHELRTPLNAIIGFSDVMRKQTFGEIAPRYQVYAKDIHESGQHLLRVISDILDMSKLDAGKAELAEDLCDVAETIKRCRRLIIERAERGGVNLMAWFPPDLPALWADEVKLRQIVLNLLSNAVKFTASGGQVTVTARDLGPDEATGGVAIEVADNGIGMAPEDIPVALTPFRQLDNQLGRKYEGMGLGLPVCKTLIELHGGSLQLKSGIDAGTVATIRFPASRRRVPLAEALAEAPAAAPLITR